MQRKNLLIEVWLYYREHKPQFRDTFDDMEKELEEITGKNEIQWSRDLTVWFNNGRRSEYKKGELPPDWKNFLKGK